MVAPPHELRQLFAFLRFSAVCILNSVSGNAGITSVVLEIVAPLHALSLACDFNRETIADGNPASEKENSRVPGRLSQWRIIVLLE